MDGIWSCSRPSYRKAQARVQIDDVLNGRRRDVKKRSRRDFDESDYE